jgi:predicted DNA-binding transcriptional regulator YafY
VARQLGIAGQGSHRALADAETVKRIIGRLLSSIVTIGDLAQVTWPLCFSDADFGASEIPEGFDALAAAIEDRRPIIMVYAGKSRSESLRTVTPLAIVEFGARQYLQARCDIAQEIRTFRLDRIRTLRLT